MRRFLQNAALVAVSICLSLGVIEITLQIWNPFPFRVKGDTIVLPANMRYVIHEPAPDGGDRIVIHTKNSLGFRGPEPDPHPDRLLTMFAVGGSTTEDFYLPDGATWPELMAKSLTRRLSGIWLNNAGLDGHSTFGHYILIRDYLLKLQPKVVLLLIGINDVGLDAPRPNDRRNIATGLDFSNWHEFAVSLANASEVVGLALNLYRVWEARHMGIMHSFNETGAPTTREPALSKEALAAELEEHETRYVPEFRERLGAIVGLLEAHHILPVLITQPANFAPRDGSPGSPRWQVLELYNDVTRSFAKDSAVTVIDLARDMPRDPMLFYDDIHYNERGAMAVADIVADALCPILQQRWADHVAADCPRIKEVQEKR